MGISILLVVIVIVGIVWMLHARTLLNKQIGIIVLSHDPAVRMKRGTLKLVGNEIRVRFFWTSKTYRQGDIAAIAGYSTDDFAREYPEEYVVLTWSDSRKILLNNQVIQYREWIDQLIGHAGVAPIDWDHGFTTGTEEAPVVFYKK
ncbi:hypothetical protein DBR32_07025 [Taibaiella sp. KBW10]|uniref:hypothetical protein n=1 Tax=Taibaiella sp. KBW10 TaxID=2153357 RepID=UPI000F5B7984|nr:hypothetical protein [Taibaiella sp. KBW10]RQO31692.1 hypothetical protein DBR32_07025 [Taibaiella sp. KBW10]